MKCTTCGGLGEIPGGAWQSVFCGEGITCPDCKGTGKEPDNRPTVPPIVDDLPSTALTSGAW